MWKPELGFETPRPAFVRGVVRRLWQLSPDHRGCPASPGRVATLVRVPLVRGVAPECHGTLWDVSPALAADVISRLCAREAAGYTCVHLDVHVLQEGGGTSLTRAMAFTATPTNAHWAGPRHWVGRPAGDDALSGEDPELAFLTCAEAGCSGSGCGPPVPAAHCGAAALARVIAHAHGASGTSAVYLAETRGALLSRGVRDAHLDAVWQELELAREEAGGGGAAAVPARASAEASAEGGGLESAAGGSER